MRHLPANRPSGLFLSTSPYGSEPVWTVLEDENLRESGGISVSDQIMLREKYPALQEAWEQYLVLLHLYNDDK